VYYCATWHASASKLF
nr:immunoglobulin light chain junction region [Macaca mulatta]